MARVATAVTLLVGTAIRVDARRTVAVLLLAPATGAVTALFGIGAQWTVDAAVAGRPAGIAAGVALFAVATVGGYVAGGVLSDLRSVLQQRVALDLDRRLIELCVAMPHLEAHEDPAFLDRLHLLRRSRSDLAQAFGVLVQNVRVVTGFAALLGPLAATDPWLVLLPLFAVPAVAATRVEDRLRAAADDECAPVDRTRQDLFRLATDPGPAREIRLYRLERLLADRHRAALDRTDALRSRADLRAAVAAVAGWVVFAAGLVAALGLVYSAALTGRASVGAVALVVTLGGRLAGATAGIATFAGWLQRSLRAVGHYRWLTSYAAAHTPPATSSTADGAGDLVLDDVSYTYPGADRPVLAGVDLRLRPGQTVVLVGDNGAGKTTLVKLLAGLYAPTGGRITYAGRPTGSGWPSRVTVCLQDFCRYELALREAVGLGDVDRLTDDAAVRQALAHAGADELTNALPADLDTQLGPAFEGVQLSAGQWQATALARARMRPHPALALLDEPTANLDPETESAILRRYRDRTGTTITVLVSHRLSTARTADLVVVLADGAVSEAGSHEDLVRRGGRYAELYAMSAGGYAATVTSGGEHG